MQFSRYKFSSRTQGLYSALKNRTGLSNNILARYALCLSLKDPSIPNPDEFDENGSEILPSVLFGEHENIYTALMLDRLNTDNLDSELYFHKMTSVCINYRLIKLYLVLYLILGLLFDEHSFYYRG